MSPQKSEEEKKRAAAEKRKLDEVAAARAQQPNSVEMQALAKKTPSEKEEGSEDNIQFNGTKKPLTKEILDDYENFCSKNNITPAQKDNVLLFNTKEQAEAFFEDLAKLIRSFCCFQMDPTGKPIDNHMFSCGDGKLYKGKAEDIRKQLEDENKAEALNQFNLYNPITRPNPTQTMREAVRGVIGQSEESPKANNCNPAKLKS